MSGKRPEVVTMTHPNSKQTIRPTREQAPLYAAQGWREKASKQDGQAIQSGENEAGKQDDEKS